MRAGWFFFGAAVGSFLTAAFFAWRIARQRVRQRSNNDLVEHLRKEGLL